jgi:hypothetical protein
MTINELRQTKDYAECINKIRAYKPGFEFTIKYYQIPKAKANALKIVLQDACEQGLLESIAICLSLSMEQTEETFRKL